MDMVRYDQRVAEPYKACVAVELAVVHLAEKLERLELLEPGDGRRV